jgi:hypothetical protein
MPIVTDVDYQIFSVSERYRKEALKELESYETPVENP